MGVLLRDASGLSLKTSLNPNLKRCVGGRGLWIITKGAELRRKLK